MAEQACEPGIVKTPVDAQVHNTRLTACVEAGPSKHPYMGTSYQAYRRGSAMLACVQ